MTQPIEDSKNMEPTEQLKQIQERLDFYYGRLCDYDEDDGKIIKLLTT